MVSESAPPTLWATLGSGKQKMPVWIDGDIDTGTGESCVVIRLEDGEDGSSRPVLALNHKEVLWMYTAWFCHCCGRRDRELSCPIDNLEEGAENYANTYDTLKAFEAGEDVRNMSRVEVMYRDGDMLSLGLRCISEEDTRYFKVLSEAFARSAGVTTRRSSSCRVQGRPKSSPSLPVDVTEGAAEEDAQRHMQELLAAEESSMAAPQRKRKTKGGTRSSAAKKGSQAFPTREATSHESGATSLLAEDLPSSCPPASMVSKELADLLDVPMEDTPKVPEQAQVSEKAQISDKTPVQEPVNKNKKGTAASLAKELQQRRNQQSPADRSWEEWLVPENIPNEIETTNPQQASEEVQVSDKDHVQQLVNSKKVAPQRNRNKKGASAAVAAAAKKLEHERSRQPQAASAVNISALAEDFPTSCSPAGKSCEEEAVDPGDARMKNHGINTPGMAEEADVSQEAVVPELVDAGRLNDQLSDSEAFKPVRRKKASRTSVTAEVASELASQQQATSSKKGPKICDCSSKFCNSIMSWNCQQCDQVGSVASADVRGTSLRAQDTLPPPLERPPLPPLEEHRSIGTQTQSSAMQLEDDESLAALRQELGETQAKLIAALAKQEEQLAVISGLQEELRLLHTTASHCSHVATGGYLPGEAWKLPSIRAHDKLKADDVPGCSLASLQTFCSEGDLPWQWPLGSLREERAGVGLHSMKCEPPPGLEFLHLPAAWCLEEPAKVHFAYQGASIPNADSEPMFVISESAAIGLPLAACSIDDASNYRHTSSRHASDDRDDASTGSTMCCLMPECGRANPMTADCQMCDATLSSHLLEDYSDDDAT